jgi:hypothetical protein
VDTVVRGRSGPHAPRLRADTGGRNGVREELAARIGKAPGESATRAPYWPSCEQREPGAGSALLAETTRLLREGSRWTPCGRRGCGHTDFSRDLRCDYKAWRNASPGRRPSRPEADRAARRSRGIPLIVPRPSRPALARCRDIRRGPSALFLTPPVWQLRSARPAPGTLPVTETTRGAQEQAGRKPYDAILKFKRPAVGGTR